MAVVAFMCLLSMTTMATTPPTTTRLNNNRPVINSSLSSFSYSYNPAFVPLPPSPTPCPNVLGSPYGLLVRVQDTQPHSSSPYDVGPSSIVYARATCESNNGINPAFSRLSQEQVVLSPDPTTSPLGTEDPRVAYHHDSGQYFILYTAVMPKAGGGASAHLALATVSFPPPWTSKDLVHVSPNLFPSLVWSKSGALLVPDHDRSAFVLLFGDSTLVDGLQSAVSNDGIHFDLNTTVWLPTRPPPAFDSALVEAGPPPLPLSDGSLLFFYNAASAGHPSPKPGYDYLYAPGWVVLDPKDPTRILQRSSTPLMVPSEPWEKGVLPHEALTPNVIFVEGAAPTPGLKDTFIVWYGAADSDVGMAQVRFVQDPSSASGEWIQAPHPVA